MILYFADDQHRPVPWEVHPLTLHQVSPELLLKRLHHIHVHVNVHINVHVHVCTAVCMHEDLQVTLTTTSYTYIHVKQSSHGTPAHLH